MTRLDWSERAGKRLREKRSKHLLIQHCAANHKHNGRIPRHSYGPQGEPRVAQCDLRWAASAEARIHCPG